MTVFENLHVELCELIAAYLDVRDIGSLRLTSRHVADIFSMGRFAACMKRKSVKTTVPYLSKLAEDTREGNVGHQMQHLTLMGLFNNTWEHELGVHNPQAGKKRDPKEPTPYDLCCLHLREIFANVKKRSPHSGLASLTLTVEVPRYQSASSGEFYNAWVEQRPYFISAWSSALRVFAFAMEALRDTGMPVTDHLNLFGTIDGCSLGWTVFVSRLRAAASAKVFQSLRKLTACVAAPSRLMFVAPDTPGTVYIQRDFDPEQRSFYNPQGVKTREGFYDLLMLLSQYTPNIDSLDLHWYSIRHEPLSPLPGSMPAVLKADKEAPAKFAAIPPMPNLKTFALRGLYLVESHLLAFLETFRPTHLTMEAVRLLVGEYDAIFAFLTKTDSPVLSYHLDDLFNRGQIVHYCDVPGGPKFSYGISIGPSTLTRRYDPKRNNGVRQPIKYMYAMSKSEEHQDQYNKEMYTKFGPPVFSKERKYDFIRMVDPYEQQPEVPEQTEDAEEVQEGFE